MIQLLVWLTPRENSVKYKGKIYKLNLYYSNLKKKIEKMRIIISGILLIAVFVLPLEGTWWHHGAIVILLGYLMSLIMYMLRFPNDIYEISCDEINNN